MVPESKLELISFKLCPFVQRSVIVLLKKDVDFDITYIDLDDKPSWFLKISPFGKVPVLRIGTDVLFESAVINEYLDEITHPLLMDFDPLEKAKNRAWIEFGSNLLMLAYQWHMASNEEIFQELVHRISEEFNKIEPHINQPFFNGSRFSLIDAAFAPLFMRIEITNHSQWIDFKQLPNIRKWKIHLLSQTYVKKSVVDNFNDLYISYLKEKSPFFFSSYRTSLFSYRLNR